MTIRVDLNAETEQRLKAEARSKVLSVEGAAAQLLQEALSERGSSNNVLDVSGFHRMLEAMAQGSERLPDLPTESFSRESFYEDRLNGGDAIPRR